MKSKRLQKPEVKKNLDNVMVQLPPLPFVHKGAAMIQNPSQSNETLIFQCDEIEVLHIYDMKTQTFRKIEATDFDTNLVIDNSTTSFLGNFFNLKLFVDINQTYRIIALGFSLIQRDGGGIGLFGVFNTKTLKWEFTHQSKKIHAKFHGGGSQIMCHKQFLILSGGSAVNSKSKISVFDRYSLQLNENNFNLIGKFEISKTYNDHGLINVKHHCDSTLSKNDERKTDLDYDHVVNLSLLLFGGSYSKFEDSFAHVTIKIGVIVSKNDENNGINSAKYSYKIIGYEFIDCQDVIMAENENENENEKANENTNELLRCCVKTLSKIDIRVGIDPLGLNRDVKPFFKYHWFGFESFLIDNRYLMVFGGRLGTQTRGTHPFSGQSTFALTLEARMTNILYFDMNDYNYNHTTDYNYNKNATSRWYLSKYDLKGDNKAFQFYIPNNRKDGKSKNRMLKLKESMWLKQNCFLITDDSQHVYFISNDVTGKVCPCWKIAISTNIAWNIERIIWIAFYQNHENKQCLIQLLPKDIVNKILHLLHSYSSILV